MAVTSNYSIMDKRLAWIDNAKMIAMLFVIMGHTYRIIHCPMPEWLNCFILAFNMPFFVILSGYTSYKSIIRIYSFSDLFFFLEKLTKRMLVPAVVFTYTLRFIDTLICGGSWVKMAILEIIGISYCVMFFKKEKYSCCAKLFKIMCWLAIPLAMYKSNYWFFNMLWSVSACVGIAYYLCHFIKNKHYKNLMTGVLSILIAFAINLLHDKTSDFILFFWLGVLLWKSQLLEKLNYLACIILFFVAGQLLMVQIGIDAFNFWDYHPTWYLANSLLPLFISRILASSLLCISILLLI